MTLVIRKEDSMEEDFMAVQKKQKKHTNINTSAPIWLEVTIKFSLLKTKKFKNNNIYNVNIFKQEGLRRDAVRKNRHKNIHARSWDLYKK